VITLTGSPPAVDIANASHCRSMTAAIPALASTLGAE
jgi:hypothetical protein